MSMTEKLTIAIDAALETARDEYREAVLALANVEASKATSPNREPANVDRIHHARTRVIALEAAREEMVLATEEGDL